MFRLIKHTRTVAKNYYASHEQEGRKKGYFKGVVKLLKKTAKDYGVPYIWMLFNFLKTFIFHGESPEYYVQEEMYKYNRKEKKKRLTVFRAFMLDYKYNIKATTDEKNRLNDKKLFNTYYKDFIGRDWCFSTDETKESLIGFIKKHKEVFCKPYNSCCGFGIFKLRFDDINDEVIERLLSYSYMVEEIIEQHPLIASIHPSSVNTLRIFSLIDREGTPHVGLPIFRVGVGGSLTDNSSSGGLYFIVDKDTGIVVSTGRTDKEIKRYIHHPDTGVQVVGLNIPYYDKIVEMIKQAARVTPTLRYVGWDVAIGKDGPLLIEGNIEYAGTNQGIDGKYLEAKQYL